MRTHSPLSRSILALLLLSCRPGETGINRVTIRGDLTIPAAQVVEAEDEVNAPNDGTEEGVAVDLGFIGYRVVQVEGTAHTFSAGPNGDVDSYRFAPLVGGDLSFSFRYPALYEPADSADTAVPAEELIYKVSVYDLKALDDTGAPTLVAELSTEGTYGQLDFSLPVEGGGQYAVSVNGRRNEGTDNQYTLVVRGFDPNEGGFIVGAYPDSDVLAHGNPLGGGSVEDFVLDEVTWTWTGKYEVLFLREVVYQEKGASTARMMPDTAADTASGDTGTGGDTSAGSDTSATDSGGADGATDSGGADGATDSGGGDGTTDSGADGGGGDGATDSGADGGTEGGDDSSADGGAEGASGDTDEPEYDVLIDESITHAFLMAFNTQNLNLQVSARTHYSSAAVEVSAPDDQALVVLSEPLVIDTIQPIQYGVIAVEEEPNDVVFDGAALDPTGLAGAQDLGMLSGVGLVDVIEGVMSVTVVDAAYEGDNDIYAFTVPEDMVALISVSWPGGETNNFDLYQFDADGVAVAAAYVMGDVNPEVYHTGNDFGIVLSPGTTHYLGMFPWSGPVGEVPYTIEIEWMSP